MLDTKWFIVKWMNWTLCHFCAHTGETTPGEAYQDGAMKQMILFSRHRIRNSTTVGRRSRTPPLVLSYSHNTVSLQVSRKTCLYGIRTVYTTVHSHVYIGQCLSNGSPSTYNAFYWPSTSPFIAALSPCNTFLLPCKSWGSGDSNLHVLLTGN